MRDYEADMKLPQMSSEKDIDDMFKDSSGEKITAIPIPKGVNNSLENSKSVQEMKEVFSALSNNRFLKNHEGVVEKFLKGTRLAKTAITQTLISVLAIVGALFSAHAIPVIAVILALVALFTSINGTVQFFRSMIAYSNAIHQAKTLNFHFGGNVWVLSMVVMFLVFPPVAFIILHYMGKELKQELNKFFIDNGLPILPEK